MRHLSLLFVAVSLLVAQAASAQHELPFDTEKNVQKIFNLSLKGYDELNAWHLFRAAKILIENPHIQQFAKNELEQDSIPPNEYYKDFFDPEKVLDDALKIAPINSKLLRFSLEQLIKQIPDYRTMAANIREEGGEIQVKNYLITSKTSRTIPVQFDEKKEVTLSVRVGNDLRVSVFDTEKKKVGANQFIGDARMVSFTTEAEGEHQIKIENVSTQSNDCLLMIETR